MYIIYTILATKGNFRYVGFSDNPKERLKAHNNGEVRSTKHWAPYMMILLDTKDSRQEARRTEKYYKSGFGRKALSRIIAGIDISSRLIEGEIIDITS